MSTEPVSAIAAQFAARSGAVGSPPEHYGNPLGEQKALAAGQAVVLLADRSVITVTGPDRLTWLDSLTSQSLTKLATGRIGRDSPARPDRPPRARDARDRRRRDDLVVGGCRGGRTPAAWLDRMRFMLRVEIADRSADFATIGTLADATAGVIPAGIPAAAPNGVPLVWSDPWAEVAAGGHQYARVSPHPASAWTYREVLVEPTADLSALTAAGTLALEALRIAAWRPRLSSEADDKSIPHELDWLRSAVHLNKGCYRGQETVAKVHNLGHPPRRLVMLHLDGSEGVHPVAGDDVLLPAPAETATAETATGETAETGRDAPGTPNPSPSAA